MRTTPSGLGRSGHVRSGLARKVCAFASAAIMAGSLVGCGGNADSGSGSAVPSSDTQTSKSAADVTIGLTYIPNVQFAPVYVAEHEHYFGDNVKVRHHGQSEGQFQALANGQEDVVIASADEAVTSSVDKDLVVVTPYYQKSPVAIVVRADSDIHTLQDLKGTTVGIPSGHGASFNAMAYGLQAAGMSVDDINLEQIGYTQQAALTTKKVDAVVGFVNNDSVQISLAGTEVRNIPTDASGTIRSASMVTTREFAEAHPQEIKDISRALFKAYDDLRKNPQVGMDAAGDYIPTLSEPEQQKAALATLEATIPLLAEPSDCDALNEEQGVKMIDALNSIRAENVTIDGKHIFIDEYCEAD